MAIHQLTERAAQDWLHANSNDFIAKNEWPLNSPDLNLLDNHVWNAMLNTYHLQLDKQLRSVVQDWKCYGMTFLSNL